jgi:hypothetical protein
MRHRPQCEHALDPRNSCWPANASGYLTLVRAGRSQWPENAMFGLPRQSGARRNDHIWSESIAAGKRLSMNGTKTAGVLAIRCARGGNYRSSKKAR